MSDGERTRVKQYYEQDHTVTVPDREVQIPITCPGCGDTFPELLSDMISGASCPNCGDYLEYVREGEQENDESEDTTEQTTLVTDGGFHPRDDEPKLKYCHRCVGDTLHSWDDGLWKCDNCGGYADV